MGLLARGYCVSHLQAMHVLCNKGLLLTADSYVVKLGDGGNVEVYSLSLVNAQEELFELGTLIEVDLKLSNLGESHVLHDAETWVDEPITDPWLQLDYH